MTTTAAVYPRALHCREHVLDRSPQRLGWLEPVPDVERHNRVALLERLERDGYLFFKGIIDPEKVLEFRKVYFNALEPSGLLKAGTEPVQGIASGDGFDWELARQAIFKQVVPGLEYAQFCTQPVIKGFFEWFFAGEVHLHKRKLIRHTRVNDTWTTPAHYDLVYLREGTDHLLSAWIPLGAVPVLRGGLLYLEGSHRIYQAIDRSEGGQLRAEHITYDLPGLAERFDTRWLIADYEPGDMVVHSPYLVHATTDNVDPQGVMRLSTDIRYQPTNEAKDPRWQQDWHDQDGL
jgi:ectoine hydroxylase-related dioxygenase (phytanoyl-CoA dioxygenase family)